MLNPDIFIEEIEMIKDLFIEYNIKKYKMEYWGFKIEEGEVILNDNIDYINPAVHLYFHKKENKSIDEERCLVTPLKYNKEEFKEVIRRLRITLKTYRNQ